MKKAVIMMLFFCDAFATKSVGLDLSGPGIVGLVSDFFIMANITNTGNESLRLLHHPNSLISNLPTEKFHAVRKEGQKVPSFIGVRAKFVQETAAAKGAYTFISPGESVEVTHDVSEIYDFSSAGGGTYTLTPSFPTFFVLDRVDKNGRFIIEKLEVSSFDPVAVIVLDDALSKTSSLSTIVGRRASRIIRDGGKDKASYLRCSESQQAALRAAAIAAQGLANEAYEYLQDLSPQSPSPSERYQTWFGEITKPNYDTVKMHYGLIKDSDFSSYTYDCTCNENSVYAFVRAIQCGVVYICAFWTAPPIGVDSQGGTLLHESSHFTCNGGTMDYVYGQDDSKSLAANDPDTAVMNADSHEYFAENPSALV